MRIIKKHLPNPNRSLIDQIYVINLPKRKDRLIRMETILSSFGLSFDVVQGVRSKVSRNFPCKGGRGCYLAKMKAMKIASQSNNRISLILEDDCVFVRDWYVKINQILHEIHNQHIKWDMFVPYKKPNRLETIKKQLRGKFDKVAFPEISFKDNSKTYKHFTINYKQGENHAMIVKKDSLQKIMDYWSKIDKIDYRWNFYSDIYLGLNDSIQKICSNEYLISQDKSLGSDNK